MTIQEAIEKAVEGRYGQGEASYSTFPSGMFIDPVWWQSLGKGLGWEGVMYYKVWKTGEPKNYEATMMNQWLHQLHRFIDHLAEGGSSETFFQGLH